MLDDPSAPYIDATDHAYASTTYLRDAGVCGNGEEGAGWVEYGTSADCNDVAAGASSVDLRGTALTSECGVSCEVSCGAGGRGGQRAGVWGGRRAGGGAPRAYLRASEPSPALR